MVGIFQKINLLLYIYIYMYGNVQIVNLRASEKQHCCNYQAVCVCGWHMYVFVWTCSCGCAYVQAAGWHWLFFHCFLHE